MKKNSNNPMNYVVFLVLFSTGVIQENIVSSLERECRECIQVGGIFERGFHSTEGAFRLAMEQHNHNASSRRYQAHFLVDIISTKDAFKIARLVCNQFANGVWAILASVEPDSFDTLHSYANTFQMPLLTPSFPENVPEPSSGLMDYAISLQPDYHKAILDVIDLYKWDHIIYIYDSQDGLLRLQHLFRSMNPSNTSFALRAIQRVSSAVEALEFLRAIEQKNRWSNKYVVLDSKDQLAKDLIIRHVQDVQMGRRNYHYLLAGLVMDDRWEEDISEYGALNITGFHLVDITKPYVKSFLQTWRNLKAKEYPGAGKFISAESALIYDSVRLLTEAVSRYQRRNPIDSLSKGFRQTLCDLNGPEQAVFRKGEAIARLIRKISFEGLTGNISFDEEGRRHDFSLDIVQMTIDSKTEKIGMWSDIHGLHLLSSSKSNMLYETWHNNLNKTYVITSILEKPFLMLKQGGNYSGNDIYEGYIKDLIDIIADKIGFNYSLQQVKDNTYGTQDSLESKRWNGIVGELIKQEADIAVAPLTITSTREEAIDFTKPFMSVGVSIMIKRPSSKNIGVFSFLSPFSEEIWMCIIFACVGVSIVLFLVSRFSPYEWRVSESYTKTTLINEFSICNSLWFTLGAIMQQRSDASPRSLSGRVVGCVWWFFTLILISSYTANMAAFLTVERMTSPIKNADDLSKQSVVEYGMTNGGSTKQFFERSQINVYSRMWDFMVTRKHVFTHTTEEGIERVRTSNGKYAFLLESVKNDYINEQLPCDTIKIGENLNENGYGVATPKGSPLRERLNMAILEMKEDGKLAQLKNKWWFRNSECGRERYMDQESSSLTLSNVAGIFYILIVGLVLSLLAAFAEFCYKSKLEASKRKSLVSAKPIPN